MTALCRAVERVKLLAAKRSTPICEMFRGECGSFGLHLASPMSKARFRSDVSFCNRRRRDGGVRRGRRRGGKILLVSPILPECILRSRCQMPILTIRVLSFAVVSSRLFVACHSPSSETRSFGFFFFFPEKYRRVLKSS